MVPELIVEGAIRSGLNLLAVTDHNSGENAEAVIEAARDTGVNVLAGMEVESREGVHILTIFDSADALAAWQATVYEALPNRENNERAFGTQLVVDAEGNLRGINRRLLITATDLGLEEIMSRTTRVGGISIPAHVDRPANGLIGVLGFIPAELNPIAVEVSRLIDPADAVKRYPQLAGTTILRSSDAHVLDDVGTVSTTFVIEEPSVLEISRACRGEMGRQLFVA